MVQIFKKTLIATLMVGQGACAGFLTNYGDPNTAHLSQAIASRSVHIVQLGDSHTAGDRMTGAMRTKLQASLGDGGMGFAMPMYFSGQRMARFGYDNREFLPISSRTNEQENYTLGGMIAKPLVHGATLTLKAKHPESPQRLIMSIRQPRGSGRFVATDARGQQFVLEAPHKNNTWQLVSFNATLPITLVNDNATGSVIGSWWAFNPNVRGAVVSAIGINGAELSFWNRWNRSAWQSELGTIHPQLVILAYGTNEAYNGVSGETVRSLLTQKIRQIRSASPKSAIMIVGSPECLKNLSGTCGTRPATLSDIQWVQQAVAQSERTLYWDWQGYMGGSCSMKSWINRGLANRDGVHFSELGYTRLGNQMAYDLLSFASLPSATNTPTQSYPQTTPMNNGNRSYIRIERVN